MSAKTKIMCLILIAAAVVSAPLFSQEGTIERRIRDAAESLTESYFEGKGRLFQQNLGVLEFENLTQGASRYNIAQGVEDLFTTAFSRSTLFRLVERRNLGAILEEQKLQLMGLTDDEGTAELGRIRNAEALLLGTVSDIGESFIVSIRLVDVETGEMKAEDIILDRADMIETKRRLDMEYISAMGVGISILGFDLTMAGNNPSLDFNDFGTTLFGRPFGIEFKYRVTNWLMLGLGAQMAGGTVHYYDVLAYDLDGGTTTGSGPFTVYTEGFSLLGNAYLVWPLSRRFSLFLGPGVEYVILNVEGYFDDEMFFNNDYIGSGFGFDEFGPREWGIAAIFRLRAGFEWFMTPRAAFSLKGGWDFGKMDINLNRQWHLHEGGLPEILTVDLGGFTIAPSVSVYF
jgi:TolB-like protein